MFLLHRLKIEIKNVQKIECTYLQKQIYSLKCNKNIPRTQIVETFSQYKNVL